MCWGKVQCRVSGVAVVWVGVGRLWDLFQIASTTNTASAKWKVLVIILSSCLSPTTSQKRPEWHKLVQKVDLNLVKCGHNRMAVMPFLPTPAWSVSSMRDRNHEWLRVTCKLSPFLCIEWFNRHRVRFTCCRFRMANQQAMKLATFYWRYAI